MGLPAFLTKKRADGAAAPPAADAALLGPRPRPKGATVRLPIELPTDVGSSAGEEWRSIKSAARGSRDGWKAKKSLKWHQWLAVFFPCFEWIIGYDWRRNLVWDVLAGCSVGFMVVPQGMSYATLAGVPSVWGLYGAFIPVLMYSVFGSSRQLAVGPVAVTSLLIGAAGGRGSKGAALGGPGRREPLGRGAARNGIKKVVPGSQFITDPNNLDSFQFTVQKRYNKSVTQLAFLVSILYTGIGILRLGFLIRFLSHPVTTGFTSGAAIIIGMSQIAVLVEHGDLFNWREFAMGMSLLVFLITLMVVSRRYPKKLFWLAPLGPMIAALIGVAVVGGMKFNYLGAPIKAVLTIPRGMPKVTVGDWLPFVYVDTLVPLAFIVMIVDMLESTSIARALARKNDYKLSYNREIIGLGVANFFGAAFNSYTTTGSFSRSALAGVFTAIIVMFVLLFLTPLFALVPYNAIGAIIIAGCTTLFEWRVAKQLWRLGLGVAIGAPPPGRAGPRRAAPAAPVAPAAPAAPAARAAPAAAVLDGPRAAGLSLFCYILETAFPHLAILGSVEKTDLTVSTKQFPGANTRPGVLALRLDAPIYFGNVQYLEDKVDTFVEEAERAARDDGAPPLEFLILDLTPSSHIDSSGCHTIGVELAARLRKSGIQVALAGPNEKVLRCLERSGVVDEVGRDWIFGCVADAVDACGTLPRLVVHGPGSSSEGSDDLATKDAAAPPSPPPRARPTSSMALDAYGFALLGGEASGTSLAASAKSASRAWEALDRQLAPLLDPAAAAGGPAAAARRSAAAAALKPAVRRGIPFDRRPAAWHALSGAAARQAAAGPGAYAALCAEGGGGALPLVEELSPAAFQFRGHALFRRHEGMAALRRVLAAFLQHTPGSYFRGVGHIAAFLLVVFGPESEEAAFWTLDALLHDRLLPYAPGQAAYGVKVELRVLDALVAKKLPKVASHLGKIGATSLSLTPAWLASLFTTALPAESAARVIDCLVLEGGKVLHRVALALFRRYEASICAASHPAQLRQVLDARAARLYDADVLLRTAFRGVGPMPAGYLQGLRVSAAAAVQEQMAEQQRRLEHIMCRTH
ncbi:SULTR2 [Scenedesmus sp. PABB004]|nr:SULTR2 [Scenedesmus sp. PABB004]